MPLPASMTAAPRCPSAQPARHQLGVIWPRPVGIPPPLLRRRSQRAASPAVLSPAGSLADETVSLLASPTAAIPADAADGSEARAQPYPVSASEGAGRPADAAYLGSGDDQDAAAASDGEDDGTAVNACKALVYAAANAVLFGAARLLHGTFTSY